MPSFKEAVKKQFDNINAQYVGYKDSDFEKFWEEFGEEKNFFQDYIISRGLETYLYE